MIQRGEIYYANLSTDVQGSEQSGCRPVLILQNNTGNKYSPTTIIAIITSKNKRKSLPTHVFIKKDTNNGLASNSTVELEQLRTIDKRRLKGKIGELDPKDLDRVSIAIKTSLGM